MAVQKKRVTIDGDEYEMTQLGALTGRRIWLKLLHVLVEPIRVLGSANLDEKSITAAVAAAVEGLDEATVEELYKAFGERCAVRVGERWPPLTGEVFDQHFAAKYVSMSKWLLECAVYNFAGFLGDTSLGALIKSVQAMKDTQQSKSPKVSTGTSGESSLTTAPQ